MARLGREPERNILEYLSTGSADQTEPAAGIGGRRFRRYGVRIIAVRSLSGGRLVCLNDSRVAGIGRVDEELRFFDELMRGFLRHFFLALPLVGAEEHLPEFRPDE